MVLAVQVEAACVHRAVVEDTADTLVPLAVEDNFAEDTVDGRNVDLLADEDYKSVAVLLVSAERTFA